MHETTQQQHNQPMRLLDLPKDRFFSAIAELGEPAYRARQLFSWLYQKRSHAFAAMHTLPKALREKLVRKFAIDKMEPVAILESRGADAVKFAFCLVESPHSVECVLLYDGKRRTACLSSQLGCGLGCTFCVTGSMGLLRNLSQEEIVGQLMGINDYLAEREDKLVTNVVFMGMGEALSNFDRLRSSLELIMDPEAFDIGGRRITISTAGVVPSIERLMEEQLNVGLAISLNAAYDSMRDVVMPINKTYPIASLVAIAKRYFEHIGRRVTFEYVLIAGQNDTDDAAYELVRLLGNFPCKINLIPVNPSGSMLHVKPDRDAVTRFAELLERQGMTATVRKSRGQDIDGACGQLSGKLL